MISSQQPMPWKTLFLLLGGYVILGYFLADMEHPRVALSLGVIVALSFAFIFLHPLTGFKEVIRGRFDSGTITFCFLVLFAGFVSIFLNWFKLFLPVFMILACEALARIDLKTARKSERSTCFWLTLFSWSGLLMGWLAGGVYHI